MKRYLLSLLLLAAASPAAATSYIQTNVRVETADATIYSGDVYISSDGCSVKDTDGVRHEINGAMAVCALKAAATLGGFDYDLQDSSYGLYLTGVADEVASGVDYWSFFVNYSVAATGLTDYEVSNGDTIILSLGGYPNNALELKVPSKQILVNKRLVVRVKSNGVPVAGATVYFGDVQKTTNSLGKARYTPAESTNTLEVYATAEGATRTPTASIRVMRRYSENEIVLGSSQQAMYMQAADFLLDHVDADGMISGSQSVTDWSAIALAQANIALPEAMQTAVLSYDPESTDFYAANEIARHILVLKALGYDPTNYNSVDYAARLLETKSDGQFGDAAYVNDDLYAGLALLASGYSIDDADVLRAVAAAKTSINENGGLSYAVDLDGSDNDTTAIFVQLMSVVDPEAKTYRRAVSYLLEQQNLDGGWGYDDHGVSNTSSTALVMQAMRISGNTPNKTRRNYRTGNNFLVAMQNSNGAFEYDILGSYSYKTLNTASAITTLAHASLIMVD